MRTMSDSHQQQLLLQAAEAAVGDFQVRFEAAGDAGKRCGFRAKSSGAPTARSCRQPAAAPPTACPSRCSSAPAQAGKVAASVADILHLEKRWDKLPGASTGSVALEDAKALLGAEVLAVSGSWVASRRAAGRLNRRRLCWQCSRTVLSYAAIPLIPLNQSFCSAHPAPCLPAGRPTGVCHLPGVPRRASTASSHQAPVPGPGTRGRGGAEQGLRSDDS